MKKKKKNSIKVAKDSNQSARARPINDPLPCEASLCTASSTPQLCAAIESIQNSSSGPNGFKAKITTLNTDIGKLTASSKKDALQTLVDVFSDFLTFYTDCSETVNLLNSDFCATIHYGKVANCNLPNPSIKLYTLYWILTNGTKLIPNFTNWGCLFTRNMTKMLFCAKNQNLGQNFAAALTTLGTQGSPAKNPFLDQAQTTDLCTGVQNMDSSNTATSPPIYNFETNFNKIYTNIHDLICPQPIDYTAAKNNLTTLATNIDAASKQTQTPLVTTALNNLTTYVDTIKNYLGEFTAPIATPTMADINTCLTESSETSSCGEIVFNKRAFVDLGITDLPLQLKLDKDGKTAVWGTSYTTYIKAIMKLGPPHLVCSDGGVVGMWECQLSATTKTVDISNVVDTNGNPIKPSSIYFSPPSGVGVETITVSTPANLANLTHLNFIDNPLSDIKDLYQVTSLNHLYLSGNMLVDITALEKLTNLSTVDLKGNPGLFDLTPLASLPKLTELDVESCAIKTVNTVNRFTSLQYFYLDHNQITENTIFCHLSSLKQLGLCGNPCSKCPFPSTSTIKCAPCT